MDAGRFVLHQAGWDNSSAVESYDPIHDSELRNGGAYGGRAYTDGGFQRDGVYQGEGGYQRGESNYIRGEGAYTRADAGFARGAAYARGDTGFSRGGSAFSNRDDSYPRGTYDREMILDRDSFPIGQTFPNLWPQVKRRSLAEEIAIYREAQRHEKLGLAEGYRDYGYERAARHSSRDRDSLDGDHYDSSRKSVRETREGSRDGDQDYSRHRDYDSDRERSRRDRDWRRRRDRDWDRSRSRDRDWSPDRDRRRDRSRSGSYDDSGRRSRSPRSHSRGWREDSYDEAHYEGRNEKRQDRDGNRHQDRTSLAPSATLVVKGLSQKTVEEDLYKALAEFGPLRHIRVIKERNSGACRGFAFVDFHSVEAAQKMMESVGWDGIVVDGRRLVFEYSSKPTGGAGAPQVGQGTSGRSLHLVGAKGNVAAGTDWMCTVCGCVNFARRTLCFQCNEGRSEDSPVADLASAAPVSSGRRNSEAGPTHVLVVRGLDESVNEETLHYEFSKYAPIKDLRLIRDKFTHVSRGFAFVHFHSIEDATKALGATNGMALEKNGQFLRVAFAKSIHGSQCSLAAAAAIEAATFAQQYDSVGWAPKEYNPDQDNGQYGATSGMHPSSVSSSVQVNNGKNGRERLAGTIQQAHGGITGDIASSEAGGAPQSGFVWDEASGYYYDSASGFYYDGHRGLYYDGNSGVWYTYDQETQQYVPYVEPSGDKPTGEPIRGTSATGNDKVTDSAADVNSTKSVVISAPAVTNVGDAEGSGDKKYSLAEQVAAAAVAAQVAAKKEKERQKERDRESRLAKGPVMGSKKKITSSLSLWKQRQHEGQVVSSSAEDLITGVSASAGTLNEKSVQSTSNLSGIVLSQSNTRFKSDNASKDSLGRGSSTLGRGAGNPFGGNYHPSDSSMRARQSSAPGISGSGLGRGAGRGAGRGQDVGSANLHPTPAPPSVPAQSSTPVAPFRTDASALGSYAPVASTKRRFSETPQSGYRDRAAERRNLHGSSLPGDLGPDSDMKEKGRDMPFPPGVGSRGVGGSRGIDMPFPPGVGAKGLGAGPGPVLGGPESESFEVITVEKAIDERNVGNRMLRNMGWQEGSGLGKEGTGIVEPVQAQGSGERAGLGSQQQRKLDARFETQPGDSYRIVIQKKALARFHDIM